MGGIRGNNHCIYVPKHDQAEMASIAPTKRPPITAPITYNIDRQLL